MIKLPTLTRLAVLLCVLGVLAPQVWADEDSARRTVDEFHTALLEAMRDAASLGFDGRRALLSPQIEQSFDLEFIAGVVTGRFWDGWDETQRNRMVERFTALTTATYAARFDGFSGQRFEVVETRALKRGRVLVKSQLRSAQGEAVSLDYVLHQDGERWKIINVVAEGVSDLSIKRADYATVLKAAGFEQLMVRLGEQIRGLAGET